MSVAENQEPEELTIHPAAEAFPMLPEDELQDLVDSITKIGLMNAIMLSSDGRVLLAGRNRLVACERAGVAPRYDWLPQGIDPVDYIYAENITRRDLSKGQKALACALIYPEIGKVGQGRGRKDPAHEKFQEAGNFSQERLRQARVIVRHPDLTELVKAGEMKFDMALDEAQTRERIKSNSARYMAELRANANDLATLVAEERLDLQEAWAAYEARKREAEQVKQRKRAASLRTLEGFLASTTASANADFREGLVEDLKDPEFEAEVHKALRLNAIDRDATRLAMVEGAQSLTAILQALL